MPEVTIDELLMMLGDRDVQIHQLKKHIKNLEAALQNMNPSEPAG